MPNASFDRRSLMALLAGASLTCLTTAIRADENTTLDEPALDNSFPPIAGNLQLQVIGALGVGHIQSTLGLIGVIADSISKEIYNQKQIDDLMKGTINGLDTPKKMLRRLQDTNVSGDDAEYLDRMISVLNALQREARALSVYSKTRKPDDAAKYERERRLVLRKLGELTHQEELLQPDPPSRANQTPKTNAAEDASN
ncbi:hypothetical protein [Schlesneria paludicola]|uniref:hypothetical protein n=1 Tax=Schlesneria paludicola TaxID=360056 RepID=UPI000299E84E|nr:hypothetical protein [Schlesneria paludicola]